MNVGRRELLIGMGATLAGPALARHRRMDVGDWDFGPVIGGKLYSYDENGRPISMRKNDTGDLVFDFPPGPGQIDYLTTRNGDLSGIQTFRLKFNLGEGRLKPVGGDDTPARIRLHIQRAGDNWSGAGQYQNYRFWALPLDLVEGEDQVLECALDHSLWTNVYGQTSSDGFDACCRNAARIGMTFGGTYAGHGVRTRDRKVTFVMQRFQLL